MSQTSEIFPFPLILCVVNSSLSLSSASTSVFRGTSVLLAAFPCFPVIVDINDINRFYGSADRDPDAAFETLRRYHVTHVIVREDRDRVHRVVLERLRLLLRLPDVSLYAVPPP